MRTTISPRRCRALVNETGLELWRVYNARILEDTNASDRFVTHYDAILTQPRAELERILDFAGVVVAPNRLDEAVRIVSPRMRHQRAETVRLNPELAALYQQLSCDAGYDC